MSVIAHDEKENCIRLKFYKGGSRVGALFSHQRLCSECLEWLHENDISRFEAVLGTALRKHASKIYPVVAFAASKGYEGLASKITFDIDLLNSITKSCKPYYLPDDSSHIPDIPGIYILVINNGDQPRVIYVGESSLSIKRRWISHHKRDDFLVLIRAGVEISMYCLIMPMAEESAIKQVEQKLIQQLRPTLNNM